MVRKKRCPWGWKGRYTMFCPICWFCGDKDECKRKPRKKK